MKSKIRIRLRFDIPPPSSTTKCFMLLVNKDDMQFISDVEHNIGLKFGFASSRSLSLSIDGFSLIPSDDIEVLRDGDEICVSINEDPSSDDNVALPCVDADEKEVKTSKKRKLSPSLPDTEQTEKRFKSNHNADVKTKNRKGKKSQTCKGKNPSQSSVATDQSSKDENVEKSQSDVVKNKKNKEKKKITKNTSRKEKVKHVKCGRQISADKAFIAVSNQSDGAEFSENATKNAASPMPDLTSTLLAETSHGTSDKENLQLTPKKKKPSQKIKTPLKSKTFKESVQNVSGSPQAKSGREKKTDVYQNKSFITRCPIESNVAADAAGFLSPLVEDHDALKSLSWPPRNGDLIAFKLLEMTDDYVPAISKFMEARVMEVDGGDPRTSALTIEILWPPLPSKPKQAGKFDLVYDDDELLPPQENPRVVSWPCLLEPKLIEKT